MTTLSIAPCSRGETPVYQFKVLHEMQPQRPAAVVPIAVKPDYNHLWRLSSREAV